MIAEHAAVYAEEVLALGVLGTTIFFDFMPETDETIMVFYDGKTWELAESSALSVDQFGVEIYARSRNPILARNKLKAWHKKIMGFSGDMPNQAGDELLTVSYVDVDMNIHSLGRDEKNRSVYSARYRFRVMSSGDSFRL